MDYNYLAELLFPDVTETPEDMEKRFPKRELPEGAVVSRMAPSPTGFVHLGNLMQGLTSERLAHQSGGIMYLRVEDTDAKREVKGATETLIEMLSHYGIFFDEGAALDENGKIYDKGIYGPYKQSRRAAIYHVYAKKLVKEGKAYPCFCTEEELERFHSEQEAEKANFGYYGKWAKWRDRPIEDIEAELKAGKEWVLRFRSTGSIEHKFKYHDLIKGDVDITENDIDHVLLKSDGIPTYHFAHAVDDHLMRVTQVIRGDEWVSSLPLHLELFRALGFKPPKYAHTATIMKDENGSKRKISKRKDPEAAVSYYHEEGIPADAVVEYLLNIANSTFEPWRRANPNKPVEEFDLQLNKMSVSGAVFDMVKLLDVSKNVISKYTAEKIYEETLKWAEKYNQEFAKLLKENKDYSIKVLNIERGKAKPRKDIAKWSDVENTIEYMYNDIFENMNDYEFQKINDEAEIKDILNSYIEKHFNISDDKETWFNKMKDLAEEKGYAREVKEYKSNPEAYKGHVGDISTVIRVALTTKHNTPDLYEIMQVLGKEEVEKRIRSFIE